MFLEFKNCSLAFGGIHALSNFSANVHSGELLGIIGPNGAGKSTLFNLLTGIYAPDSGGIFFKQEPIHGLKPHRISHRGIARTFQNIRLFPELTVEENVLLGFHHALRSSFLSYCLKTRSARKEEELFLEKTRRLLDLFHLSDKRFERAKNLCYGNQRKLEIVRALATSPDLLLLDEPAAGMNRTEKKDLVELIREIHATHSVAILLIEHDMHVVMSLCPRILVLNSGKILAEGSPDQVRANPQVIEAYLGGSIARS